MPPTGATAPSRRTTPPQQGVFAGAFSPDGKRMALVSNIGSWDFHLYWSRRDYSLPPPANVPVRACQVSWRSDGQELAVMQPRRLCSPTATGDSGS